MPATSYPKAIGGVCQSTIDYPACRCWTVKRSNSMVTNCIWPYKGHAQLSTRQASLQCIWPIRALGNQTHYPRVHHDRQAIPEFNKGETLNIRGTDGQRGRETNQTARDGGTLGLRNNQSDSRQPMLQEAIIWT